MPKTVTVTLKLHDKKYMQLRQHVGNGEIEGHDLNVTYGLQSGGPIIQIGEFTFEATAEEMVQQIFDQIVA